MEGGAAGTDVQTLQSYSKSLHFLHSKISLLFNRWRSVFMSALQSCSAHHGALTF